MKSHTDSHHRRKLTHRAFLGLGSNIGDREANLKAALSLLESAELRVAKISSLTIPNRWARLSSPGL